MGFFQRIQVGQRFALVGIVAIVLMLVPTLMFISYAKQNIQVAQRELRGIEPIRAVKKVIQLSQQHRGLSSLALSGDADAQASNKAKQAELDKAYAVVSGYIAAGLDDPQISPLWKKIQGNWNQFLNQMGSGMVSKADSFDLHTQHIGDLFQTLDLFADEFGLSLDPDLDSYQLVQTSIFALPALGEGLGKVRAKGAGVLASKVASPRDLAALNGYLSQSTVELNKTLTTFNKAAKANEDVKQTLEKNMQEVADLSKQAIKLATREVMDAYEFTYDSKEFFAVFTKTINLQAKFNDQVLDQLTSIIEKRISSNMREIGVLLGIQALLTVFGVLMAVVAVRSITRQLGGEPVDVVNIANAVARGDLASRIKIRAGDDTSIMSAMWRMQQSLHKVVGSVRQGADAISSASAEIANGNADLSSRTESQASALEETAASMEELGATVKHNAESSRQANQLAQEASVVATQGGQVVAQVVGTMKEINDSSKKISDIIGVIDGIAFQTNILALNAAVEAARAGEQGRGFAVVASEVRSLAGRSAEAAKEIKTLINASVDRVAQGSALVDQAGSTMEEVVGSIRRVTDIMREISAASTEQSQGVAQVGEAVSQMDQSTQQNAALVEEMAASATGLKSLAQDMVQAVSVFKLDDQGGTFVQMVEQPSLEHLDAPRLSA